MELNSYLTLPDSTATKRENSGISKIFIGQRGLSDGSRCLPSVLPGSEVPPAPRAAGGELCVPTCVVELLAVVDIILVAAGEHDTEGALLLAPGDTGHVRSVDARL